MFKPNARSIAILFSILYFSVYSTHAQDVDTLVDIGTHNMHFKIWQGTGTPILFESGGGNDANIWNDLASDIYSITGTTIITYDRIGYGQSEMDPNLADDKKALITNGVTALKKGLIKLNYFDKIILVAHSYGGYYATFLAANYPEKIKGMVLIDVVLSCFHTAEFMQKQKEERTAAWLQNIKGLSEPLYYECLANAETIEIMKKYAIPDQIPVINLVADNPPYEEADESERWKKCHREFVNESENRTGILAAHCGHYLHFDHRKLAVDAIVKMLIKSGKGIDREKTLINYLDYSAEYSNDYRQREYQYWHSERDINRWGYNLMGENNLDGAIKLFELNTILFPNSSNVWDSYGEILLIKGDKKRSIEMYQKALEIDPENESSLNALKNIQEQKK